MPLIALNKPFGTICQFSPHETRASLGDWVKTPGVYPAGRLDADSEGLLLLTDDGALQTRIAEPRHKLVKRYWAQVEGAPDEAVLEASRERRRSRRLRDAPVPREFVEPNRRRSGRARRRSAIAPRSRRRGSNSRSPKARIARCDA